MHIERLGEKVRSSVAGEEYTAYVPKPLPPNPPIVMDKIYPLLITDSKKIVEHCKFSLPSAIKSLNELIKLGVVQEITGKARNKIYAYRKNLDVLNQGTSAISES